MSVVCCFCIVVSQMCWLAWWMMSLSNGSSWRAYTVLLGEAFLVSPTEMLKTMQVSPTHERPACLPRIGSSLLVLWFITCPCRSGRRAGKGSGATCFFVPRFAEWWGAAAASKSHGKGLPTHRLFITKSYRFRVCWKLASHGERCEAQPVWISAKWMPLGMSHASRRVCGRRLKTHEPSLVLSKGSLGKQSS